MTLHLASVGGISANLSAASLLLGSAAMVWPMQRARPWLMVLWGINSGHADVTYETLRAVPLIDVLLLLLAGATYSGFWPGPGTDQKTWMVLAIGQPLLGIAILAATRLAGRSALMGGLLVLSVLMLLDGTWSAAGWLGVIASTLLLAGDFGTTSRRRSRLLATAIAVGYGALIIWFAWVAALLLA